MPSHSSTAFYMLNARKAAIIHQDFLYGEQVRDGFTAAFYSKGGEIVSVQKVPFGTIDMAPYIEGLKNPDLVCLLLTSPSDVSFMRQYHEFGLKMPVIYGQNFPQGEYWKLQELGEDIIGMYGCSSYSPLIDTTINKQFREKFKKKHNFYPGVTTVEAGYWPTLMILEALKVTGGDTDPAKVIKALEGIKKMETPAGTISIKNRINVPDEYVFKAIKIEDSIHWEVAKKYPSVQPR